MNPAGPQDAAVAVRWRDQPERSPRVTAKGRGLLADRIVALARESGVPIREDRDLLRILSALDLDVEVPPHCFRALAEIMAHLYRANQRADRHRDPVQGPQSG